jgi:hypothetical protein
LDYCPTGTSDLGGYCARQTFTVASFNYYDRIGYDWTNGGITVQGGFFPNDKERDDPIPIAKRGLWFDGMNAYQMIFGLTLNTAFTMEFW